MVTWAATWRAEAGARARWRPRLLWASLALNAFLLAGIAGRFALTPDRVPPGPVGAWDRMARDLPQTDADRFRAVLDRERPWYDEARRRMEADRASLARAIGQTPYDEAAVQARLRDFQGHFQEMSDRFGRSLLQAVGELTPDGRARLAVAADKPPRR